MKKYLITYEFKDKSKSHLGLYSAIQNLGPWWHYLDSTWIVKNSRYDSGQMYEILRHHFTKEDRFLIIEIDPLDKQGWLPAEAWTWINS